MVLAGFLALVCVMSGLARSADFAAQPAE